MTDGPPTVDAPWPIGILSAKIKGWIDKLGTVWVEGEITQWGVSGGNVYGKLKDLEADATVSFTIWGSVRARIPDDLKQGDRVVALVKPNCWVKGGIAHHAGVRDAPRRARRPARATRAAAPDPARRGAVRRRRERSRCRSCRTASGSSPAATATPRKTCCATPSCAGPRSSSGSPTRRCRARRRSAT